MAKDKSRGRDKGKTKKKKKAQAGGKKKPDAPKLGRLYDLPKKPHEVTAAPAHPPAAHSMPPGC